MKAKFELRSTPNTAAANEIIRSARSVGGVTSATVDGDFLEAEFDSRRASEADIEKAVGRGGFSLCVCDNGNEPRACREKLKKACYKSRSRALVSFFLTCVAIYLACHDFVGLPILWWLDDDYMLLNVIFQGILAFVALVINLRYVGDAVFSSLHGNIGKKTISFFGFAASLVYSLSAIGMKYLDVGFSSPMIFLSVSALGTYFDSRKTRDVFCIAEEKCHDSADASLLCASFSAKRRERSDKRYSVLLAVLLLCAVAVGIIYVRSGRSARAAFLNATAFAAILSTATSSPNIAAKPPSNDIVTPQNAASVAFTPAPPISWGKTVVMFIFPLASAITAVIFDVPTLPLCVFILPSVIVSCALIRLR